MSIAAGRTLATMLLTESDTDETSGVDRPSARRSEAFMIRPVETAEQRGTVAYLPTNMSLVEEFGVTVVSAEDETSSCSELVQRDRDGGHSESEPARQWP